MSKKTLFIIGDDPAGQQQYHYCRLIEEYGVHPRVMAVNRSFLRMPGCHIDYLTSMHEELLLEWEKACPGALLVRLYPLDRWEAPRFGFHYPEPGVYRGGGSALAAVGAGSALGFERIVIIGVGLTGAYEGFRAGWEKAASYMKDHVRGTDEFLETLLGPIPPGWFL